MNTYENSIRIINQLAEEYSKDVPDINGGKINKESIDDTSTNLKVKVTSLNVIVTGTKENPYFEIKYKEVGKEHYNIGYGSYDLNNVLDWKEECFEIIQDSTKKTN